MVGNGVRVSRRFVFRFFFFIVFVRFRRVAFEVLGILVVVLWGMFCRMFKGSLIE